MAKALAAQQSAGHNAAMPSPHWGAGGRLSFTLRLPVFSPSGLPHSGSKPDPGAPQPAAGAQRFLVSALPPGPLPATPATPPTPLGHGPTRPLPATLLACWAPQPSAENRRGQRGHAVPPIPASASVSWPRDRPGSAARVQRAHPAERGGRQPGCSHLTALSSVAQRTVRSAGATLS